MTILYSFIIIYLVSGVVSYLIFRSFTDEELYEHFGVSGGIVWIIPYIPIINTIMIIAFAQDMWAVILKYIKSKRK